MPRPPSRRMIGVGGVVMLLDGCEGACLAEV